MKNELFEKIVADENDFLGATHPAYGQVVLTGMIQGQPRDFEHAIGYVTQIRKGRGQYGSDQFLIRHPSGQLATHENQAFWRVNDTLAKQALTHFSQQPEAEGGDTEYTVAEGFPEVGYLIEHAPGDPVGESPPFSIRVEKK